MTEPVPVGDLTVTVDRVFCPPSIGQNSAAPGKQFVVVALSVQNNGTSNETVSAKFQSTLHDGAGVYYKPDDLASQLVGNDLTGVLPPGQTLSGQIGFQVPTDATGLVYIFDSHPFGNQGQAFIAIQ